MISYRENSFREWNKREKETEYYLSWYRVDDSQWKLTIRFGEYFWMVLYRMYGMNCTVPYGAGIVLCFASKYSMLLFRTYVHSTYSLSQKKFIHHCNHRNKIWLYARYRTGTVQYRSDSIIWDNTTVLPLYYHSHSVPQYSNIRRIYYCKKEKEFFFSVQSYVDCKTMQ